MSKMREELAVVVPCYNAGARVRPVLEIVSGIVTHTYLVDDGSTDCALDGIGDLAIKTIILPCNQGKGAALLSGFRMALGIEDIKAVAVIDADGQHDPTELPRLWETFEREEADLVIGARSFSGGEIPWRSWLGNRMTIWLTNVLTGRNLPDTQSGFRIYGRGFLEEVVTSVSPGRYETEMEILVLALRGGRKVVSEPIKTLYERGNPSSHFAVFSDSWRVYRRLFLSVFRRR
jgi:glycosyltransferase involved in cell wall biosynthesis